jgi:hypothetical protein
MKRFGIFLALAFLALFAATAGAHVGSPDVFFEGKIGPYPAAIVIRMPSVIPGRSQIEVRTQSERPLEVSILPLFSKTAVKNSPPADAAPPVVGESGVYRGDLWLMHSGAYSIEVRLRGEAGEGVAQIPIDSEATHQLPLPKYLATVLLILGAVLLGGGLAIIRVAAGESTLPPGESINRGQRRKGLIAASVAALVFTGALVLGYYWWNAEEANFRKRLREGAWPDLVAEVHAAGAQRILRLIVGDKEFGPHYTIPLLPDHGKILHTFLVGENGNTSIAHVHPVRKGGKDFEVVVPPLAEGDYRIFVDLALADGLSTTTTGTVHLPPMVSAAAAEGDLKADADDSWSPCAMAAKPAANGASAYTFEDGLQLVWKAHPAPRLRQDAGLQFEARDSAGQPVALEPYMGMMSHAAVMRTDGKVFSHLHPTGNFSMAAQMFFEKKVAVEKSEGGAPAPAMDHSKMHHGGAARGDTSSFSLPYEYPTPGNYIIWVQFKTGGQVRTARFEASVPPAPGT